MALEADREIEMIVSGIRIVCGGLHKQYSCVLALAALRDAFVVHNFSQRENLCNVGECFFGLRVVPGKQQ